MLIGGTLAQIQTKAESDLHDVNVSEFSTASNSSWTSSIQYLQMAKHL